MDTDVYDLDALQRSLKLHVEWHATLGSTNDRARELASQLPPQTAALVIADEQTAGRGRGTNRWWTGAGSIAATLLTRQHTGDEALGPILSLAAGLAVVDTLSPYLPGKELGIHWPNDIFVGGRKIAGILVEALADGRRILGIGINVNNTLADAPYEVSRVATTLFDLTGERFDRTAVVRELAEQLLACVTLAWQQPQQVAQLANQACLQRGLVLTVAAPTDRVTGRCLGIADDGALLLETSAGVQSIYSGTLIPNRE